MRHPRFLAALLLACLALVPTAHAQTGATTPSRPVSDRWRQVRMPDFTVIGTARDGALKDVAASIAIFRKAFGTLFTDARLNGAVPTNVVVIDDFDEFRRYQTKDSRGRRMSIGGYFSSRADENLLVFPYGASYDTAFHEYTHYFVRLNVRAAMPTWLSEGLAEFYATFVPDYQGKALVGAPDNTNVSILRSLPYMPVRDVVAPKDMEAVWNSSRISSFYAESWALVHYIVLGRTNPVEAPIDVYLRTLAATNSQDQAFMAAFGVDVDGMNKELRQYIQRFSFQALQFPKTTAEVGRLTVDRVPEATARRMEAALLLTADEPVDATTVLQRGLTAEPGDVEARVMLGRVQLQQDKDDLAVSTLSEAATAAPRSFAAHYYLGRALQKGYRQDEALAAFSRATDVNALNPYAWMGVTETALALGRDAQANATFQRAMQVEPNPAFIRGYAAAAFDLGRNEVAASAARRFIAETGMAETGGQYVSMLGAIAEMRLGKTDPARALLATAEAATRPGTWTLTVLQFLQGKLTPAQVIGKADTVGERTEAHTYVALLDEVAGRREDAVTHFRWVVANGARNYSEFRMSEAALRRLDPAPAATAPAAQGPAPAAK